MVVLVVVMAMVELMVIVMNDVGDGSFDINGLAVSLACTVRIQRQGQANHKKKLEKQVSTTRKTNNKVLPDRASEIMPLWAPAGLNR